MQLNRFLFQFLIQTFVAFQLACQPPSWNKIIPASRNLGSSHGFYLARTITHLHSPISYDACDAGNKHCLADLRSALCINHIDFAFLTDHIDHMATTEFADLLLYLPGDERLTQADGTIIGNQITCSDGQKVQIMAGYESQLMPIGMTNHLGNDVSARGQLYGEKTDTLVNQLRTDANAIVMIPHTESKENRLLSRLHVDGIEIYNLHANINPTMRTHYLGMDYFSGLIDLTVYWIDPYGRQQPDLAFISFLKVSPIYAAKWDYLIGQGQHVTGIGGNDSHQNFLPGTASDGDRVDSHRRLTRWILNYFMVKELTLPEIKASIRSGKGWVVFEGLGTPTGMTFYAQNNSTIAEMGDSISFQRGTTKIHIEAPTLHPSSPQNGTKPTILIKLKKVNSSGIESIVASSINSSLDYFPTDNGAYRVEVGIVPLHLLDFIGYKKELAKQEMPWLISNHIYLE